MDEDGNVLATERLKQEVGGMIAGLAGGKRVARILAGAVFTSDYAELVVPNNGLDNAKVVLAIDHIYFHHGKTEEVPLFNGFLGKCGYEPGYFKGIK